MRGRVSRGFFFASCVMFVLMHLTVVDELAGGMERGSEFGGSESHGKPKMTDKVIGGAEKVHTTSYPIVLPRVLTDSLTLADHG